MKKGFKGMGFWSKLIKIYIKKYNPFIFATFFSLILMELILAYSLSVMYFKVDTI
jgi:hypothetical protein